MIAFIEARRAGLYQRENLWQNIVAGVIVGIVAMPLAMAFAIASGAKPEQGLYTAIVAGLATSLFGGTRVQISGPTGAFIAVLAGVTAQYGIPGLQVATLMAGVMLLIMGIAQLGGVIKFIPSPVIVGFTSGIGVIIWVGQWKDFFGLKPAASGLHFHEKTWAVLQALPSFDIATTCIAVGTLIIIIFGTRVFARIPGMKRIPSPLVAMLAATAAQAIWAFPTVATIGTAYGDIPRSLPLPAWPEITFAQGLQLVSPAFAIALLGAIESLLTAVVADGMTGTRHNSNQELVGQGIANILSPVFGGFAATGAIARTATNIRNGATSPVAGITHAALLILVILLLAPWASHIPLAALAAILFVVAWNMSDVGHFARLLRSAPRTDKLLLLLAFGLTVFVDLVVAVNVGVMVAALLFMRRMANTVTVQEHEDDSAPAGNGGATGAATSGFPRNVMVYSIDGPFFFGAAEKLENTLEKIRLGVDTIVIRLARVPFIDATGMQALVEIIQRFRKKKVRVILCDIPPKLHTSLERAEVLERIGPENICGTLAEARQQLVGEAGK